jgi:hypothetical protein
MLSFQVFTEHQRVIAVLFESSFQQYTPDLSEYAFLSGVYRTLRAEFCVVSNMLSLEHLQAQSAVFILDG